MGSGLVDFGKWIRNATRPFGSRSVSTPGTPPSPIDIKFPPLSIPILNTDGWVSSWMLLTTVGA